jgi:hypothetical protein
MSRFFAVFAGVLALGTAQAAVLTNTFSLPTSDLTTATNFGTVAVPSVHEMGVTFTFTGSSSFATYGDTIGTAINGLEPQFVDTVLDGAPDGTLTLTFDAPTTFLSFNVLFIPLAGPSGGKVTIDGNTSSFSTLNGTSCSGFCSTGSFSWTPVASFQTAVITFDSSAAGATFFAIDNLSYSVPDTGSTSTPEPASVSLLAIGSLLVGAARMRRLTANR